MCQVLLTISAVVSIFPAFSISVLLSFSFLSLSVVSSIFVLIGSYFAFHATYLSFVFAASSLAFFSVSSLSFVSETACFNNRCFWASNSVFVGSSLNNRSTSLSCDCVFLMLVLTCFRAVCSLVVSAPSCIVMPFRDLPMLLTSSEKWV